MLKGEENWILEGTQTVSDRSAYIKAFTHTHTKKVVEESERTGKKGCYPCPLSFLPVSCGYFKEIVYKVS